MSRCHDDATTAVVPNIYEVRIRIVLIDCVTAAVHEVQQLL